MTNLKRLIQLTTLVGALATAGVAQADGWRGSHQHHQDTQDAQRTSSDVIGTQRLAQGRGVASFQITPEQRRDGLELRTSVAGLQIVSVDFGYSDGRVVRLPGRRLHAQRDGRLTIQTGRPPGLRTVRVTYVDRSSDDRNDNGYGYDGNGYDGNGYDGNGYDGYGYGDRGNRPRGGTLQLIQLHTGDGYTHTDDLWQNRDPDGDGGDDVDGGYPVEQR